MDDLHGNISQQTGLRLILRDPLLKLLIILTRGNALRVALLTIVFYAITIYGFGILINFSYSGNTQSFLPVFDKRDLAIGIFDYFIIGPLSWALYVQDSAKINQVFQGLVDNNVVDVANSTYSSIQDFLKEKVLTFNRQKRYFIIIFSAIVISALIWTTNITNANNPFKYGYKDFWWHLNPFYYWLLYLPATFLITYTGWWIFFRRFITILIINEALRKFKLIPQLFHPDRANGFSPIGQYVLRVSPYIVVYSIWIFVTITLPDFFGRSAAVGSDTFLYFTEYSIAVPTLLILPVWRTHQVMSKFRFDALDATAKQIRSQLAATEQEIFAPTGRFELFPYKKSTITSEELGKVMASVESLEQKYRLYEKEYRKWPFRRPEVREYFFTTALPLLIAIISVIVQLITLHK